MEFTGLCVGGEGGLAVDEALVIGKGLVSCGRVYCGGMVVGLLAHLHVLRDVVAVSRVEQVSDVISLTIIVYSLINHPPPFIHTIILTHSHLSLPLILLPFLSFSLLLRILFLSFFLFPLIHLFLHNKMS